MNIRSRSDVLRARALLVAAGNAATSETDGLLRLQSALLLPEDEAGKYDHLAKCVAQTSAEKDGLLTIVERHNWQKQMAATGHLNETAWLYFAGLDVEHFYVILRSLFDHLSQLCSTRLATKSQRLSSFNDLLNRCEKQPDLAEAQFGKRIVAAVRGCDWFREIQLSRDGIVHAGSLTLALPVGDTVSFRVDGASAQTPRRAELRFNENLADFELFIAWTIGGLGVAISEVCDAILSEHPDLRPLALIYHKSSLRFLASHLERLATRFPPDAMPSSRPAPRAV
jgi:hypothetical protein